jgi:hypothetical protein
MPAGSCRKGRPGKEMLEQILEILASDAGRNILTSLAALLTITASVYAFFRWLRWRHQPDRRATLGTTDGKSEAMVAPKKESLRADFRGRDEWELEEIREGSRAMTFGEVGGLRRAVRDAEITSDEEIAYYKILGKYPKKGPPEGSPDRVLFVKINALLEPAREREEEQLRNRRR